MAAILHSRKRAVRRLGHARFTHFTYLSWRLTREFLARTSRARTARLSNPPFCYGGKKPVIELPVEEGKLKPVSAWTKEELLKWAKTVPSLADMEGERVIGWWERWKQKELHSEEEWWKICRPSDYDYHSEESKKKLGWFYDLPVSDCAEMERLWEQVEVYCRWTAEKKQDTCARLFDDDAAEVIPGLWISSERAPRNLLFRHVHNISTIIGLNGSRNPRSRECQTVTTVWKEDWFYKRDDIKNMLLGTLDMLQILEESHRNSRNVLVHCTAGENRSALLIGMYLAHKGYKHLEIIRLLREANKRRNRSVCPSMAARECILLLTRVFPGYGSFYPFGMTASAIKELEERYEQSEHSWGLLKQRGEANDIDVDDDVTERETYAGTKKNPYYQDGATHIELFLSAGKEKELQERRKKGEWINYY